MATEKRLIDANALTDQIIANFQTATWDGASSEECQLALDTINEAETVDAVGVVSGHWKYGTRAAVCSECGFERHLDVNFGAAIACPNCGAKME